MGVSPFGDIVEAQISFESIRLKGNQSMMAIILRAITMLDKRAHDVSASISSTYTQLVVVGHRSAWQLRV
jgi:hypothetical protein